MPICNKCGSKQAAKAGLVGRSIQRYRCKDCGHKYRDTQPLHKPTFDECCDSCLTDEKQKEGAKKLSTLFHDLKMKPSWYHSNSYKCHYKGKRVVYINVYSHLFRIFVCTSSNATGSTDDDFNKFNIFFQMIPIEMKNEFIERLTYCKKCTTCAPGHDLNIEGKLYRNVCNKSLCYWIDNPTSEQIEWIIKFIHARREYIINHLV